MIFRQSVFESWPIESESIQSIITSPPYYALRKYSIPDVIIGGDKDCKYEFELKDMELGHENRQGKDSKVMNPLANSHIGVHGKKVGQQGFCIHCRAWKGQYGLEPRPSDYIEHTRLWAKEAWRVLRKDGIFFLNLADSYGGSGGDHKEHHQNNSGFQGKLGYLKASPGNRNKPKCQLLIPERISIMLVEMGWIRRNFIIWYKPNAMPESVTDRFSKKWEPIFFFTKQEKYYFDLDAVREPHKEVSIEKLKRAVENKNKWVNGASGQQKHGLSQPRPNVKEYKGGGRKSREQNYSNMGSGYPAGDYLVANLNPLGKNPGDVWQISTQPSSEKHFAMWPERLVERMIKCSTKAGDIVLDPFAGSGTTLKVAEQLYRKGIGIDLGYHDISKRRISKIQKQMFV